MSYDKFNLFLVCLTRSRFQNWLSISKRRIWSSLVRTTWLGIQGQGWYAWPLGVLVECLSLGIFNNKISWLFMIFSKKLCRFCPLNVIVYEKKKKRKKNVEWNLLLNFNGCVCEEQYQNYWGKVDTKFVVRRAKELILFHAFQIFRSWYYYVTIQTI